MKKLFIISLIICSCSRDKIAKPVYVEYFKIGDVLLPDMAIADTLIVMDAIGLNKGMALIEQGVIDASDLEIAKVFYKYCKQFKTK